MASPIERQDLLRPIGVVTSKPATLADAVAAGALRIEQGNTVFVVGTNGSGDDRELRLLMYYADGTTDPATGHPNGTFWPRGSDRPIKAGSAVDFDGIFEIPTDESTYFILLANNTWTGTAFAIGKHLRGGR